MTEPVYDFLCSIGELVDNLSMVGQGRIDNEIKWDLTNIDSGVYYAEVSANSG